MKFKKLYSRLKSGYELRPQEVTYLRKNLMSDPTLKNFKSLLLLDSDENDYTITRIFTFCGRYLKDPEAIENFSYFIEFIKNPNNHKSYTFDRLELMRTQVLNNKHLPEDYKVAFFINFGRSFEINKLSSSLISKILEAYDEKPIHTVPNYYQSLNAIVEAFVRQDISKNLIDNITNKILISPDFYIESKEFLIKELIRSNLFKEGSFNLFQNTLKVLKELEYETKQRYAQNHHWKTKERAERLENLYQEVKIKTREILESRPDEMSQLGSLFLT